MENRERIVILGAGESGTGAAILARQKGFDVFGHHMIKNALFRMARVILKSGFADTAAIACQ